MKNWTDVAVAAAKTREDGDMQVASEGVVRKAQGHEDLSIVESMIGSEAT